MSSILQALERAEKERNQLDKRTFMDRGAAAPGLLQRRGLWVFAGMLLLINLLIWFWVMMGPEQASEQSPSTTAVPGAKRQPVATADTVVSILEQPQGGKQRKSAPPLVVEALVAKKAAVTEPAAAPVAPVAPKPMMSSPDTVTAQAPVKVVKVETTEPVKPAAVPADVTHEPVPTAISAQSKIAKVTDSQATVEQKAETIQAEIEQDETEKIPLLWELPANVQEKLSDLKINILVYNDDAAQRFVIINMRKYREGDRLVPSGMQLERITRKGIVIDYGDGLVRL